MNFRWRACTARSSNDPLGPMAALGEGIVSYERGSPPKDVSTDLLLDLQTALSHSEEPLPALQVALMYGALAHGGSDMQTHMIHKLGFEQNHYTFTLK